MPVVKRFANLNERARDYWIAESVKDKLEDHFEVESELAAGPFGTLLKCRPRGQQRFCCVKVIPKQKSRRLSSKEMSFLMKLSHSNVGRLIDIFETTDTLYVVSELLSGGEVLDRVSRLKNFSERDAAKILRQVLEGLRYIHEEGVTHCNLKPENLIFENDDEESNVKIADVGIHALLDRELLKHAVLSTPHYCAPEILRNDVGHPSADMWSFGVFAYLLLVGEEPFKADNDEQLYKKIIKGQYDQSSENYQKLSVNAKDFLMKFLVVDPQKRLTAFQALMTNQWLQGKATNLENMSQTVETMREAIVRKKTLAFLHKQALRARTDKPSLTQKYLPKDVWLWLQKTTKYGTSLIDCVKSAAENPDSLVGLYAPDPDCYDTFQEIFWPVIADYHKVDVFLLKSVHDFGNPKELPEFELKYAENILSFRIRVGRTLKGYPMGPKLSRETRQQIQEEMVQAFRNFNGELYGDYIELNELSYKERDALIQSHYLFNNADNKYLRSAGGYADWPLNRGIFMNRAKSFVVWLNEEDHVRIISMEKGADVRRGYARLIKAIEVIEQSGVQFVYHEKFGYLTFCPTNIGTGLKVSVHVRVPRLAESGKLKDIADSLNLQLGDESDEGVFAVSNKVSIGHSEFDLINSMCSSIKKLLDTEFAL